jgi:hypothetical protein
VAGAEHLGGWRPIRGNEMKFAMRVITAITANLVALSYPNIVDANWLARCESADGLRYCEACGTSGRNVKRQLFCKMSTNFSFLPISSAFVEVLLYRKHRKLV